MMLRKVCLFNGEDQKDRQEGLLFYGAFAKAARGRGRRAGKSKNV